LEIFQKNKEYERKIRLETQKDLSNGIINQIKRISKGSRSYELLLQGKKPVQVAIEINLCYDEIRKHWKEYLRLRKMNELYQIYIDNEYQHGPVGSNTNRAAKIRV
jgi:hypothetical protein